MLAVLLGCHGTHVEEAEHHTPAHKPADYPAAIDRLLELHAEIANGGSRAADQLDVFAELNDVVRWLPELAADSDLDEELWNVVYDRARRLETIVMDVQSHQNDGRSRRYFTYETELDQHHRALSEIKQHVPPAATSVSDHSP